MIKKIDVDALLADNQLELTLDGQVYTIKDISLPTFLKATKEVGEDEVARDVLHRQLAEILGVEQKKLENLGLKAITLAINAIREWILEEAPEDRKGKKGAGDKLPSRP